MMWQQCCLWAAQRPSGGQERASTNEVPLLDARSGEAARLGAHGFETIETRCKARSCYGVIREAMN